MGGQFPRNVNCFFRFYNLLYAPSATRAYSLEFIFLLPKLNCCSSNYHIKSSRNVEPCVGADLVHYITNKAHALHQVCSLLSSMHVLKFSRAFVTQHLFGAFFVLVLHLY